MLESMAGALHRCCRCRLYKALSPWTQSESPEVPEADACSDHRLRPALQVALRALLDTFEGAEWVGSRLPLAKAIGGQVWGSSSRARLLALQCLPVHTPRGLQLQQSVVGWMLQAQLLKMPVSLSHGWFRCVLNCQTHNAWCRMYVCWGYMLHPD